MQNKSLTKTKGLSFQTIKVRVRRNKVPILNDLVKTVGNVRGRGWTGYRSYLQRKKKLATDGRRLKP